jgi:hypothetical protein
MYILKTNNLLWDGLLLRNDDNSVKLSYAVSA